LPPIEELIRVMARLRDPSDGCAWDLKQNFASIAPYTIEEAYEVADAIARNHLPDLQEELGDLLLQVVFHSQMAHEQSAFNFDDVANGIVAKLIRRHPHIFSDKKFDNPEDVAAAWEAEKAREREQKKQSEDTSALAGIALALPALIRAEKVQKRAARVGFDWPDVQPVWEKLAEEITEVQQAVANDNANAVEDEIGDLLFTVVNLARHLSVDPEASLTRLFSDLTLYSVVLLLAAGQGLFLAIALLVVRTGNWRANRYLGLFTFAIVIAMVDMSIDGDSTDQSALFIRTLIWPREFLYGPAIYLYVREMTLPGKQTFFAWQWLHFLPAIFHAVVFWTLASVFAPLLLNSIQASNADTVSGSSNLFESVVNIELLSSIVHVSIYLLMALQVLRTHRQRIASTFSYNEKISLNWLRWLLFGVIGVYLVWVFTDLLSDFIATSDVFEYVLGVSMVVLVYSMSFLGLRQPVIFTGQTATHVLQAEQTVAVSQAKAAQPEQSAVQKYKTSSLSDDLSKQLVVELQSLMGSEKPHLDSQLTLPQLAGQLGISSNYLSQIINEQLQQNFFEFVNAHRVDNAKSLLNDDKRKKENILTIALDSGFNSKSSFYTAFKKHTQMTPGEFRKRA